ncbi:hypothetical protein HZS_4770 [Henneguya salminicola]|nr:hypothetical protein HZS_4770 [Henneguya salminicola]
MNEVQVSNGLLYFDVLDTIMSKDTNNIYLNNFCEGGYIVFKPKYRIPDFNPENKNLYITDPSIEFHMVHTYIPKLFDTIEISCKDDFASVSFKKSGLHALCFAVLVDSHYRLALFPKFFMVNPIQNLNIPRHAILVCKVDKNYIDDLEYYIDCDEENASHIRKFVKQDESSKNLLFLDTYISEFENECFLLLKSKTSPYEIKTFFNIESIEESLNDFHVPLFNSSKLGCSSLIEIQELVKSVMIKEPTQNMTYLNETNFCSKINDTDFAVCMNICSDDVFKNITQLYIFELCDPNGITIECDVKNFDYMPLQIVLFKPNLIGLYKIKIFERERMCCICRHSFIITQSDLDSNDFLKYISKTTINVNINLSPEFLLEVSENDFTICVLDPEGDFVELHAELITENIKKLIVNFKPQKSGYYFIQMRKDKNSEYNKWKNIIIFVNENESNTELFIFGAGKINNIYIYKIGLYYARIEQENNFYIDASKSTKDPRIFIEGPAPVENYLRRNEIGTYKFTYIPKEPGSYTIKIFYPYFDTIYKEIKVNVYGRKNIDSSDNIDGIEVKIQQEIENEFIQQIRLNIPNKSLCIEDIDISVCDRNNKYIPVHFHLDDSNVDIENHKTIIKFSFKVSEFGRYKAFVRERDINLPGSPFNLNITKEKTYVGAVSCVAYGPSLAQSYINKDNYFYVDMKDAGEGTIKFIISGPTEVKIVSEEYRDLTYIVHWIPICIGSYSIDIKFDEIPIPGSPFLVNAIKKSKIKRSKTLKSIVSGILEISKLENIEASGPGLKFANVGVVNQAEDKIICNYSYCPPVEGDYVIGITVQNISIQGAPFIIKAIREKYGSSLCYCEGSGINQAVMSEICKFRVDTKEAGTGYLVVSIESTKGNPADSVHIRYLGNGIYSVEYKISFEEKFNLNILFNGLHVVGSPVTLTPIQLSETKI